MDYCCTASCHRATRTLGSISVAGQIYSDYNFIGILTGPSEARHQQAAWWFLISFSTGGCYSGNTARVPHEEMSACNDLSCLAFSELKKIVLLSVWLLLYNSVVCLS